MAKQGKNIHHPENQSGEQIISKKEGGVEKITNGRATEIARTFTRHAGPREVIEHAKYKLYPIETGKIRFFTEIKGEGFIIPDKGDKDVYVRDFERTFKDGEVVSYIDINHEALITEQGYVKKIMSKDIGANRIFITPNDESKHKKDVGNLNVSKFSIKDLLEGDEVEFVANKKGNIVAIKKIEKTAEKTEVNLSQAETNDVVTSTPRELADEAARILYAEFGTDYNLNKEEGRRKYHIARKDIIMQLEGNIRPIEGKIVLGEGQMIMEVNSKGKLKIRLNTNEGGVRYMAEDLSNEDLVAEIPAIKAFIFDNTNLPSTSKFKI